MLIIILLGCLLFACNSENPKNEVKTTFIGTFEEITDNNSGQIEVQDGVIFSSGSKVYVDLSVNATETLQI